MENQTQLDLRRRWAEMFCVDPDIWVGLAEEYHMAGRLCMAEYCQRHADHYAGKDEQNAAYTGFAPEPNRN